MYKTMPMKSKLLVTGAGGFLGCHIVPVLRERYPSHDLITVGRTDYDLLKSEEAVRMMEDHQPDTVIHLAAKVGGIMANKDYPADFFYENMAINLNTFEAAFRSGVKKLVTFMGGCSYPSTATSPIGEDQMWNGIPQGESAPYSIAKKMLIVQSAAYRKQHGFNSIVLIPGNIYGEYDNFNWEYAHVIPAMIRRFIEARESGAPSVACYGSGRPTRDFAYAGDVAQLIPWFIEHYNASEPINLSSGTRTSIHDLAESIKRVTGYAGTIEWDTSKPDGQIDKIFDVQKLHALGLRCDTSLEAGLRRTVTWFEKARREEDVRI